LFAEKNKERGGQSKKTSAAELTPIHQHTNTPPTTPHNKGNKKATKQSLNMSYLPLDSARTFVMAAVSVVLPWSTCPIVPMLT